ncbi:unnamed protein product [Angiostrongylus costaricensis]|uniref:Zinc finger, C2H2 type n=1 Tax=Angiostrongylus costaricensis TaxID=334426 RepID=A0A158PGK1_ANGCS|nr:unnamed protein product [Angiostrongylus costaricensis]
MSTEPDSLRRSKRNKFHLDVAAMHLANPERRRAQQGRLTPSPDVVACRTSSLSPADNTSPASSEPSDEKSRRVRRTPARNASYVFEDSDDDDCRRGLEGTNLCVKCPARFETRPGLANHFKLHFGEKRKFACELCDFSATTPKSLRLHQKVHDRFGVGPATFSDPQENQPHIEGLHCEMSVESTFGLNSSPPQLSPPIVYSVCPSRSHTELVPNSEQSQSRRAALTCPMTPPPNLVRVNASLNPGQECRKEPRKCPECPYLAKTASSLKIHNIGHEKQSGFLCPFCTFKSESTVFLKRHVEVHGCSSFTWPPTYVGLSPWKSLFDRNSAYTRSRSIMYKGFQSLLFLRCASQHAPIGSPMRRNFVKPKFEIVDDFMPKLEPHHENLDEKWDAQNVKLEADDSMMMANAVSFYAGSANHVPKGNEFTCALCPYTTSTRLTLQRHETKHHVKEIYQCAHCSFSGRTLECIEKHSRLHQKLPIDASAGSSSPSPQIHLPPVVLLPVTTVPSLIPLSNSGASVITVSLTTGPGGEKIALPASTALPITFATIVGSTIVPSSSMESVTSYSQQQQTKCPPRRSATESSLRFIGQHPTDDEDSSSTPLSPTFVELKCDTGSESCLEDHMIVHSESSSVVDTGAAPSPSPSADLLQKSCSEKSVSPDFQETPILNERQVHVCLTDPLSSSTEVSATKNDVKNPITVRPEYEQALRPTKEVLPVLKCDRKTIGGYQCSDCPFIDSDKMIFDLHREMHGGRARAFACNLCNYRKRGLGRRGFQPSDPIPLGAKHFACTQCSFRTVNETTFVQHRQQHAQHIQQRLVTQMKRAASQQEEDSKRCSKVKRVARKSDKHVDFEHACLQCTFRCDTSVAFSRHLEMHSQNALFKCRICDYSANTKNIVDYHEQNHHLGHTLTDLRKSAILAPDIVQLDVTASNEERARFGGQDLRCRRCHFSTLDLSAYTKHWEQNHRDTPEDREVAGELRMKLVPPSSILTTA